MTDGCKGLLEGLGDHLEPLERADRIQKRCSKVGFDWNEPSGAREKVTEELLELDDAMSNRDPEAIQAELGDLMLAVTNLARLLGVDSKEAMHQALDRFRDRFAFIELSLRTEGLRPKQVDIEKLEALWQKAKDKT